MASVTEDPPDVKPDMVVVEKKEPEEKDQEVEIRRDNGIFAFMTPDRAIELYKRIHAEGPPDLEWKFYGRRNPEDQKGDEANEREHDKIEEQNSDTYKDQTINTEFDFDESFTDISTDTTSIVNESLQLKQRSETSSEKKTNLKDIMCDIMKENNT